MLWTFLQASTADPFSAQNCEESHPAVRKIEASVGHARKWNILGHISEVDGIRNHDERLIGQGYEGQ